MADDILKTPIPTPKVVFGPVGKCIYCGAKDVDLSDEHIVPVALNGTMILPKASCKACALVTSRLELIVARTMYGVLRNKRGYNSRRKKNRPNRLPVSYITSDGGGKTTSLDLANYPGMYLTASFPPPGILIGAPLTEMNPEMQLYLMGDPQEVARALSSVGIDNIRLSLSHEFHWGALCRVLAKVAHSYLVARVGIEGYIAFLPDLILGRSRYLSHYVGGIAGTQSMKMMSHYLELVYLPTGDALYLAVNIHLLGSVTMPTYQVVAAKVTDPSFRNNFLSQPA